MGTYKRIVLLFVFIFVVKIIFGQQPVNAVRYDLYQQQSNLSKEYIARDQVVFYPGYQFNGYTDGKMVARIDPNQIFPSDYTNSENIPHLDTFNIDFSKPVANIPGQIDVSPTGAAIYSVPIELPQGTNAMQPHLSISYSSQSGNGMLGFGFNLSGLSVISRVGKTKYFDNNITNIAFNNYDKLMLDGIRLIIKNGNYFEENSTYLKEIDDFSEIKFLSNNNGFVITTKDGMQLFYGQGSAKLIPIGSDAPLSWYLNKVKDRFGNYINYVYDNTNGEIVLKEIQYTGNDNNNALPYVSVKFLYDLRKDSTFGYIYGYKTFQRKILHKIQVWQQNLCFNEYTFDYFYDQFYSKLFKITYTKNSKSISTIFNYGLNQQQTLEFNNNEVFFTQHIFGTYDVIAADFNNDAKTDILVLNYEIIDGIKHYNKITLFEKSDDNFIYKNTITPDIFGNYFTLIYKKFNFLNVFGYYINDFTGDFKNDFALAEYTISNNQIKLKKIKLFENLAQNNNYTSYTPFFDNLTNNTIITGDFDGNGINDFIINSKNSDGHNIPFFVRPTHQQMYVPLISNEDFNNNLKNTKFPVYNINFNNNLKEDILIQKDEIGFNTINSSLLVYELSGNLVPTLLASIPFSTAISIEGMGDFNGDGLTDLIIVESQSTMSVLKNYKILYSNGKNNFVSSNTVICTADKFISVSDINGDGLSDFIFQNNNTKFLILYINQLNEHFQIHSIPAFANDYSFKTIGDFDANGTMDYLCFDNAGYKIYYTKYNTALLTKIRDNYGQTTTIEYSNLSKQEVYQETQTIQFKKLPIPVVQRINYNYSTFSDNVFYLYKDGLSVKEKNIMFAGFAAIEKKQQNSGLIQKDFYKNGIQTYKGIMPFKNEKYFYDVNTSQFQISNSTQISYKAINNQNTLSFFLFPDTVVQQDYLLQTKTLTNNDFDTYGNLVYTEASSYYNNTLDINTKTTNTYVNAGLSIPNRPASATTTTTYNGQLPYTRSAYFTYDNSTGALLTKFTDSVLTAYAYWPRGAVKTVTTSANGLPTLTTAFDYDPSERFNTRITNPKGWQIQKNYDFSRGLLLYEADMNNQLTKYEYDELYRLKKTIYPDGNISEQTIEWFTDNTNPNIHYFIKQTATNRPYIKTYYDILGRVVKNETIDAFNRKILTHKTYNAKYQLIEESDAYFETETPQLTTFEYLYDGRLYKKHIANIKTITYNYNGLTTTIKDEATNVTNTTKTNTAGQIIESVDPGGKVTTVYNSMGKPLSIITGYISSSNNQITTFEYDQLGYQRFLHEPNAGTTEYKYNAYGQLEYQIDAKGNRTDMQYDILGRMIQKSETNETCKYFYDEDSNNKGALNKETTTNGYVALYQYDALGRMVKKSVEYDNKNFDFSFQYNNFGDLEKQIYPMGFGIKNVYNSNGYLTEIIDNTTHLPIWQLSDQNSHGQITKFNLGNGLNTQYIYDEHFFLTTIQTGTNTNNHSIQQYLYHFNPYWARPEHRYNTFGYSEEFSYDNDCQHLKLNRLTDVNVWGEPSKNIHIDYFPNGNISYKNGIGVYQYDVIPNAVARITLPEQYMPVNQQNISWTPFNQPAEITESDYRLAFNYGIDRQRIKTQLFYQNQLQKTKYFTGNYEQIVENNQVKHLYYIDAPTGLTAIYAKDNQHPQGTMYYIHSDHLGNITEITDPQGNLEQRLWYNAWGERELLVDNTGTGKPLFDRGFTTHEHLDEFGLINMNGRLYDPKLSQFLSPDNFVSDAAGTQAYNRYAYCLNNPMVYTDPSGEFVFTALAIVTGQWWALPMAVGADLGMWQGGSLANGTMNPLKWNYSSGKTWGYMAGGAITGAAAGYIGGLAANGGGFMANTTALAVGSYVSSAGTYLYSGGQTDVSVSFGLGSYNANKNNFTGLWNWSYLSSMEKVGYFLGGMGNLNDVWNVAFPNQKGTNLYTDKEDPIISHTAWGNSESKADALISFGPDNDNPFFYEILKGQGVSKLSFGNQTVETVKSYSKFAFGLPRKSAFWDYSHYNNWKLSVTNINKVPLKVISFLSKALPYQGLTLNCVNIGSIGAWVSGIPNIGLHPWLFHGYMQLYTMGLRPDLFGYYLIFKY